MDTVPLMLLVTHLLALGVGCLIFIWMVVLHRRNHAAEAIHASTEEIFPSQSTFPIRPASWLAIRSVNSEIIQAALGKNHFSFSAPANGWIIVAGADLPTPGDDVDACYLFLTALSRELGHVQFYYAEKFSAHHAWARLENGIVIRAYAWTGETVWNQGDKTSAEIMLQMNCPDYGENSKNDFWTLDENLTSNLEKIPLLAARWSIDPAIAHRVGSITGETQ